MRDRGREAIHLITVYRALDTCDTSARSYAVDTVVSDSEGLSDIVKRTRTKYKLHEVLCGGSTGLRNRGGVDGQHLLTGRARAAAPNGRRARGVQALSADTGGYVGWCDGCQ